MGDVGRYRKLYARLWRHPDFRRLSTDEQLLAIYLLTGPQTNRIGLYHLSLALAAEDLETSAERIRERLANICRTFGWTFDEGSRVVWIASWFRWNLPENRNVLKSALKDLSEVPIGPLTQAFFSNVSGLPETYRQTFMETYRQTFPKGSSERIPEPMPYQEQEQEQEQEELQLSTPSAPALSAEDVQRLWNEETTKPIPRCEELPAARRKHAEARLRDRGLEGLKTVFNAINRNPFYRGENDLGWRATIDWALKPSNIVKVMEGAHERVNGNGHQPRSGRTGAAAPGTYDHIEGDATCR